MTEFRTDKLSNDQRLAALEDRVGELELMLDGLFNEVQSLGCEPGDSGHHPDYDEEPL